MYTSTPQVTGTFGIERIKSTQNLLTSERRFAMAMQHLQFGRFEHLKIGNGELILDPWPITVRAVKFSTPESTPSEVRPAEFELKKQVADFFEYVRAVDDGEIRCLEFKHGIPFSMEIDHQTDGCGEPARCLK